MITDTEISLTYQLYTEFYSDQLQEEVGALGSPRRGSRAGPSRAEAAASGQSMAAPQGATNNRQEDSCGQTREDQAKLIGVSVTNTSDRENRRRCGAGIGAVAGDRHRVVGTGCVGGRLIRAARSVVENLAGIDTESRRIAGLEAFAIGTDAVGVREIVAILPQRADVAVHPGRALATRTLPPWLVSASCLVRVSRRLMTAHAQLKDHARNRTHWSVVAEIVETCDIAGLVWSDPVLRNLLSEGIAFRETGARSQRLNDEDILLGLRPVGSGREAESRE